jgi:pimeloyl-ACP methyl ester carboxylesterase
MATTELSTVQSVDAASDEAYVRRFGAPPRSLRVQANGAELHLLEWGDPDGEPVLMVHGMRAHARWFTPVGPAVGTRFRALSLDLRGHGDSAHTPPYGHAIYAQDVAALVNALDLQRPILVGHSMGGGVTARAAAALGTRLRALVIVDSAFGPPPRPSFARRASDPPTERTASDFASWHEARARFKLRPGDTVADPELLDHLALHALRALPGGRFAWRFDPNVAQRAGQPPVGPPDVSAVRCPVISIWGEHSPMLRRIDPRDVAERFPSAAWTAAEIVAGAHHHVFLDQPDAFNAVLLRYLQAL